MKTLKNKLPLMLALGCSLFVCQITKADPPSAGAKVDVPALMEKLGEAINALSVKDLAENKNTEFAKKIGEAIDKLKLAKTALSEVDKNEADEQNPQTKFREAETSIREALAQLDSAGALAKRETQGSLNPIKLDLNSVLSSLKPANVTTAPPASSTTSPVQEPQGDDDTFIASVVSYGIPALQIATVLLVVGLLLYCAMRLSSLRRSTDEYFVKALPQSLSGVKSRQDELAKQIDASAAVSKDINQRLTEVHTELRLMSRMLQQANLTNNRPANYPGHSEPAAPPGNDGPAFPIAADELLRQMQNKSVVVKRDFQNDMLVSDPEGKGELVLLRDSRIADEMQPLFLVPRVTQFQMRQEYYNFYEKYYECAKPESGLVWILDPAVVEKVVGGWELREKGRLEVR